MKIIIVFFQITALILSSLGVLRAEKTPNFLYMVPSNNFYFSMVENAIPDENDNIYVFDFYFSEIRKYDKNGNILYVLSKNNTVQLGDITINSIHVSGNKLYVYCYESTTQKTKMLVFGSDGLYQSTFDWNFSIFSFDKQSNIYAVDTSNYCIKKFNSVGVLVKEWGSYGSGRGEFTYPYSVAIDNSDNVYVCDLWRIQKFDPNGSYMTESPWQQAAIKISPSNTIYTYNGNTMKRYNTDFQEVSTVTFVTPGAIDGDYIRDANFDKDDNIIISNSTYVSKFSKSGVLISKWLGGGTENGRFYAIADTVTDNYGYIYSSDSGNGRIQKFNKHGEFITTWKIRVPSAEYFSQTYDIAYSKNDNVVLVYCSFFKSSDLSFSYSAIHKYDINGDFISEIKTTDISSEDTGIQLGRDFIYATNNMSNNIMKLTIYDLSINKIKEISLSHNNSLGKILINDVGFVFAEEYTTGIVPTFVKINIYNEDGVFLKSFSRQGEEQDAISIFSDITDGHDGNVYISSNKFGNKASGSGIKQFNYNGDFIACFFCGKIGNGPGEFETITSTYIDKDKKLYTSDISLDRFQVFDMPKVNAVPLLLLLNN